jgi:hypothetical protein
MLGFHDISDRFADPFPGISKVVGGSNEWLGAVLDGFPSATDAQT